jgi:hypothetical protein
VGTIPVTEEPEGPRICKISQKNDIGTDKVQTTFPLRSYSGIIPSIRLSILRWENFRTRSGREETRVSPLDNADVHGGSRRLTCRLSFPRQ